MHNERPRNTYRFKTMDNPWPKSYQSLSDVISNELDNKTMTK